DLCLSSLKLIVWRRSLLINQKNRRTLSSDPVMCFKAASVSIPSTDLFGISLNKSSGTFADSLLLADNSIKNLIKYRLRLIANLQHRAGANFWRSKQFKFELRDPSAFGDRTNNF